MVTLNDDGLVFHLMRRVLQRHQAHWAAVLPDLTKMQFAVLRAVAAEPDNDQNLIGERTAIDKATLAPLIGRLVERGWLARCPDAADRRRRRLSLTAEGRAAMDRAAPLVAQADAAALVPLNDRDKAALLRLLGRLG